MTMCYYNGVKVRRSEYIRLKALEKAIALYEFLAKPLHIGFEYGNVPVLRRVEGEIDFDIVEMEWGFLPPRIKTREEAQKFRFGYTRSNGQFQPPITTLNAMGEELLLPFKMYREAALGRRCLVLSSGFYEWRHVYPLNKRTGQPLKTPNKYPYHITVRDKPYFFIAGIWQPWKDESTGEYVETLSLITTSANGLMEQIHNSKKRMPSILNEDLAWEWLFGDLPEERIREIACYQFPANDMQACTIAKDFREALDPMQPFEYEDLPALDLAV
jgi:putative SOS response-associated peptidase YedK